MTTERPDGEGLEALEATQPFDADQLGGDSLASAATEAAHTASGPLTTPMTVSRATGRRGGLRWGIALGVVAVSVGLAAAAAFILTSQSPASRLVGWAPAGAAFYAEARLDLPGDQRAQLGEFLAHFPGFADQAILDAKIDEALDRIVSGASDGRQDFSTKIKPWFDGQIAVAAEATSAGASGSSKGEGLALVAIKDEAGARAWFEAMAAESVVAYTVETYGGTEILVIAAEAGGAAAFLKGVMLMGDPASVRAAIDSDGASGLAKAPKFVAARGAFTGDQLGFAFVDLDAAMALAESGTDIGASIPGDALGGLVPDWLAMSMRTDGSGLTMEAAWPHIEGVGFATTNRAGRLAGLVPASTILLTDARDIGAVLQAALAEARSDPASAEALAELDQAANLLGGVGALIGWVGDVGVAVTQDGSTLDGGIVIVPTDQAAADRLATTLGGFIQLFGAESGLEVSTEDHAGTEITIIDLGDAQDLLGLALDAGSIGELPIAPVAPGTRIQLAWAVSDDVVVIALGPAFVRAVLDVDAGSSLAADARYRALLGSVGTENAGSMFVDLRAILAVAEGLMTDADPAAAASYQTDIKPYLAPFDAWVQVTTVGDDIDQAIMRITVD